MKKNFFNLGSYAAITAITVSLSTNIAIGSPSINGDIQQFSVKNKENIQKSPKSLASEFFIMALNLSYRDLSANKEEIKLISTANAYKEYSNLLSPDLKEGKLSRNIKHNKASIQVTEIAPPIFKRECGYKCKVFMIPLSMVITNDHTVETNLFNQTIIQKMIGTANIKFIDGKWLVDGFKLLPVGKNK